MSVAAVLADSPLAFYLLDEDSGSVAIDDSGNGRDGTHVNDPIRLGCAMSYGGTVTEDDTTFGNAALALSVTGGTWESWFWMNEIDGPLQHDYANLRDNSGTPDGDDGWFLYANTSGGVGSATILYRVGGTQFDTGILASTVQDQTWRHFAITYDASETRYFIDGVHRFTGGGPGSAPSPGPGASAVALPWHVAKNGELSQWWTFRAARVAFFSTKLSDARIAAHAAGAAPCSGGWVVGSVAW